MRHTLLVTVAAGGLAVAAAIGTSWQLLVTAVLAVAVPVAVGQRWRLAGPTATGLLVLAVLVATGPAAAASWGSALVWVAATWCVVFAGAGRLGPVLSAHRQAQHRRRRAMASAVPVLVALALVPAAALGAPRATGWAAVAGVAVVVGTALTVRWGRPGSGGTAGSPGSHGGGGATAG